MPHDFWQYVALFLLGVWVVASLIALRDLDARVSDLKARVKQLEDALAEPQCRVCKCTNDEACWSGCWWVEDDLCSSCADDQASSGSSLESESR